MSSTQKRAILQVRIREEDKQHAERLYDAMGTSLAEAVRLFVAQSILMRKLPFQPVAVRSKDGTAAYGLLKAYGDPNRRSEELINTVPFYLLRCNMELSAAQTAHDGIFGIE